MTSDSSAVRLRHYYDEVAADYAADIEPAFAPLADLLLEAVPLAGVRRVIDLGTGSGLIARSLAGTYPEVCALDFSMSMLRVARRHGVHRVLCGDLHKLPLRDKSFDLALASFAFNSTDPATALREARRILTPNGDLMFQEWGAPDALSEIISDTLASYAVDEPSPALARVREQMEQTVPWDDLNSIDDIRDQVAAAGFEVNLAEVHVARVEMASVEEYMRYKLAWPNRKAEVEAMSRDVLALFHSDLEENLQRHAKPDGKLTWQPEIIQIRARRLN